jgi:hypothetical protein
VRYHFGRGINDALNIFGFTFKIGNQGFERGIGIECFYCTDGVVPDD